MYLDLVFASLDSFIKIFVFLQCVGIGVLISFLSLICLFLVIHVFLILRSPLFEPHCDYVAF